MGGLGEITPVIIGVHLDGQADLVQSGGAMGSLGLGFGGGLGGQEHSSQDGNDGDDHQEFDQGERGGSSECLAPWREPGTIGG